MAWRDVIVTRTWEHAGCWIAGWGRGSFFATFTRLGWVVMEGGMDGWMDGWAGRREGWASSFTFNADDGCACGANSSACFAPFRQSASQARRRPSSAGRNFHALLLLLLRRAGNSAKRTVGGQVRSDQIIASLLFLFLSPRHASLPPLTTAFPIHFGCSLTPSHLITMMPKCEIKRIYCTIYTNWSIPSALKRGSGMELLLGKEMGECDGIREGLLRWMDDG